MSLLFQLLFECLFLCPLAAVSTEIYSINILNIICRATVVTSCTVLLEKSVFFSAYFFVSSLVLYFYLVAHGFFDRITAVDMHYAYMFRNVYLYALTWLSFRNCFSQSNGNALDVFLKSRHSLHVTIYRYIYVRIHMHLREWQGNFLSAHAYMLVPRAVCVV